MDTIGFLLSVLMGSIILGSAIGLTLGIPTAMRLHTAKVLLWSILGSILGTFVGILLSFTVFQKVTGNTFGGGMMLLFFMAPVVTSVTAIVAGQVGIYLFEQRNLRH